MKKWLLLLCLLPLMLPAQNMFRSSFRKAKTDARAMKLPIIVCFTGSDWSPESIRFEQMFLRSEKFRKLVRNRFIVYVADLPKHRKLGAEQAGDNRNLQRRYGILRFPALVVTNFHGWGIRLKIENCTDADYLEILKKLEKLR